MQGKREQNAQNQPLWQFLVRQSWQRTSAMPQGAEPSADKHQGCCIELRSAIEPHAHTPLPHSHYPVCWNEGCATVCILDCPKPMKLHPYAGCCSMQQVEPTWIILDCCHTGMCMTAKCCVSFYSNRHADNATWCVSRSPQVMRGKPAAIAATCPRPPHAAKSNDSLHHPPNPTSSRGWPDASTGQLLSW